LLYFPSHLALDTRLKPWYENDQLFGAAREVEHPARVWLMLHGNGGQAAHREYILTCLRRDDAVYVLEYPGYGFRSGSPSRPAIDAAASAAYRALRAKFPGVSVNVIGESLGTGPACVLAQEATPPDQIVLITPFDTLASVAAEQYWFLPVRLMLQDRWDNIAALREYRGPIRIYGGEFDRIIPVRHAKALADATGASFTLLPAGHNDWVSTGEVKL
jgi:pimeloyl-ACP methyl ester carboxylesterase